MRSYNTPLERTNTVMNTQLQHIETVIRQLPAPEYAPISSQDLLEYHPVCALTTSWTIWDTTPKPITIPNVQATSMTIIPAWHDNGTPVLFIICSTPHGVRLMVGSWPQASEDTLIQLFNMLTELTPDAVYLQN